MFRKHTLEREAEEIMDRRAELMERAADIRDRFAEDVDRDTFGGVLGWTLVSSGIAFGVTQWMRGRRGVWALMAPVAMLAVGVVALGNGMWHRRDLHISEVEDRINAELAALGPIARMRVMRDVAESRMPFGMASHN